MTKTVVAFRHVHFEDLGGFAAPLTQMGYSIRYCDMGIDAVSSAGDPDLLVVLGGPIGAYEDHLYPFLAEEIALLESRIAGGRPTIGICLGAQLMARALGARVYPGRAKEIGWAPLRLSPAGHQLLGDFEGHPVLHWHGDTFDLPETAVHLAATPDCDNQAFSYGAHALAFQFHPEASPMGFERWLIGNACEIAATPGLSVSALRSAMQAHGVRSSENGRACLVRWLSLLQQNHHEATAM